MANRKSAHEEIRAAIAAPEHPVSEEWLGRLYDSYLQRFLSDNQRIWTSAALLVPISFASVPAYFSLGNLSTPVAFAFGTFSVLVILFWYLIAKGHRRFQDRSLAMVNGIEEHILGSDRTAKVRQALRSGFPRRGLYVSKVRTAILVVTGILWIAIITLTTLGVIEST